MRIAFALLAAMTAAFIPNILSAKQSITKDNKAIPMAASSANWTNSNPGLSKSQCQSSQYVIGVEAEGAPSRTKYCVGCVMRLRVICQTLQ